MRAATSVTTFYPFIKYGSGGGLEELNLFYLYSYKKDWRRGTTSTSSDARLQVDGESVYTEQKFLYFISTIQKQYRKGLLVYGSIASSGRLREYVWDLEKGSHLKMPEIIPLTSDFWDQKSRASVAIRRFARDPHNAGTEHAFSVSARDRTQSSPLHSPATEPENDDWSELILRFRSASVNNSLLDEFTGKL